MAAYGLLLQSDILVGSKRPRVNGKDIIVEAKAVVLSPELKFPAVFIFRKLKPFRKLRPIYSDFYF